MSQPCIIYSVRCPHRKVKVYYNFHCTLWVCFLCVCKGLLACQRLSVFSITSGYLCVGPQRIVVIKVSKKGVFVTAII